MRDALVVIQQHVKWILSSFRRLRYLCVVGGHRKSIQGALYPIVRIATVTRGQMRVPPQEQNAKRALQVVLLPDERHVTIVSAPMNVCQDFSHGKERPFIRPRSYIL